MYNNSLLILFQKKLKYPFENESHEIFVFLKYIGIPIFLLLLFGLIIFIIRHRIIMNSRGNKRLIVIESFQKVIESILTNNVSKEEIYQLITEFKNSVPFDKHWVKATVTHELLDIEHRIKESSKKKKLFLVYKDLHLDAYSERLLKSNKWYYKALGIYHYQMIGYDIKKPIIESLMNTPNLFLRSNVFIALLTLTQDKFGFLKEYDQEINKTDILKITSLLSNEKKIPQDFNDWFESSNPSLVIIALKLSVNFNYQIKVPIVASLLSIKDKNIRQELANTVFLLKIRGLSKYFVKAYKKETSKDNRIAMVKALSVSGSQTSEAFLAQQLTTENDKDILFHIVQAIYNYDPDYLTKELQNTKSTSRKKIILSALSHIKEPLLRA